MVGVAGTGAFGAAPGVEVVGCDEVAVGVVVGFGLVGLPPVVRGVVVVGVVVVVGAVALVGVVVVAGIVVVGPAASEAAPGVTWVCAVMVVDGSLSFGLLPPWSACAASIRMLGPVISRMTEWWTRRSIAAAVVIGSLKILSHSLKTRLLVIDHA